MCSTAFVNAASVVMTVVYLANYSTAVGLHLAGKSGAVESMVDIWFPFLFIVLDSLVLLYAVVRVWQILKTTGQKSLNNVQMAFHVSLLFLLSFFQGIFFFSNQKYERVSLATATVYNIGDSVVCCMIAYILWSVSNRRENNESGVTRVSGGVGEMEKMLKSSSSGKD